MIQIGELAATIDTPIEHLVACHRRIEQRLDTLVNAADHIEANRPAALAAIAASLHFLDTSGTLHTEDEERSLFPRLRPRLASAEIAFLDSLEAQHDEAESIYAELKQLRPDDDSSASRVAKYRACAEQLRALYREHIRSEDQILTEMARRSLDESEITAITKEMRERRAARATK